MAVKTIDLGPVSSYAIAVQHGYTGTEEQWYELIHDVTANAAAAQNSASGAAQSAQSALATLGQVVTAGETAVQAIQTEETTQAAALAEAGAAQIADIVAAKTTAVNAVVAQQGASVQAVYDKGVEQIGPFKLIQPVKERIFVELVHFLSVFQLSLFKSVVSLFGQLFPVDKTNVSGFKPGQHDVRQKFRLSVVNIAIHLFPALLFQIAFSRRQPNENVI